jgi:hypothetical protein
VAEAGAAAARRGGRVVLEGAVRGGVAARCKLGTKRDNTNRDAAGAFSKCTHRLRSAVESVRSRCQRETGSFWARCVSVAFAIPRLPSEFSKSIGLTLCGIVEEPTSPATVLLASRWVGGGGAWASVESAVEMSTASTMRMKNTWCRMM